MVDDDEDTINMSITLYIYFAQSVAFNLNNSLSHLSSQLSVIQEMVLTHVTALEATISQSDWSLISIPDISPKHTKKVQLVNNIFHSNKVLQEGKNTV